MSTDYKMDEKIIRDIVNGNVHPVDPEQHIALVNYNTRKTAHLLPRDRLAATKTPF